MNATFTLTSNYLSELIQRQPHELFEHSHAVASLAGDLAESIGCSRIEWERIRMGSLLHDIGKQFIPTSILEKQGKLSSTEYEHVQQHAWLGYDYLNSFTSDTILLNTVLYHHEHWDGSGYPYGLKKAQIPLGARICALADVWDALRSERCYHRAWSVCEAAEHIWSRAGTLFDPTLSHHFLNMMECRTNLEKDSIMRIPEYIREQERHTPALE